MQNSNVAPQKADIQSSGIPSEPLTVTLDSEASHIVRAWAEILQRDPADVASGMMLYVPAAILERYQENENLDLIQNEEGFTDSAKLICEAQKRRTHREKEEMDRIRAALNSPHMAAFARRIAVEFPADLSFEIRQLAQAANVSPGSLAEAILRCEVDTCNQDSAVLIATVDAARALEKE